MSCSPAACRRLDDILLAAILVSRPAKVAFLMFYAKLRSPGAFGNLANTPSARALRSTALINSPSGSANSTRRKLFLRAIPMNQRDRIIHVCIAGLQPVRAFKERCRRCGVPLAIRLGVRRVSTRPQASRPVNTEADFDHLDGLGRRGHH